MSYDLSFLVPGRREPLVRAEFVDLFADRPHYTFQGDRAFYGNPATRCHFWFDWADEDDADEGDVDDSAPDDDLGPSGLTFEMNYHRPFWFADEALPELQHVVDTAGLLVDDPQWEGMGRGPFVADGFRRGWTKGNEVALASLRHGGEADALTLPGEVVRRVAAWNRAIEDVRPRAEAAGCYVPTIMFTLDAAGRVRTSVTWAWGVPNLVPEVDDVLLARLPRGLISRVRNDIDWAVTSIAAVRPLLSPAPPDLHVDAGWIRDPESAAVAAFFASVPKVGQPPTVVNAEVVFEHEAYAAATAKVGQMRTIDLDDPADVASILRKDE